MCKPREFEISSFIKANSIKYTPLFFFSPLITFQCFFLSEGGHCISCGNSAPKNSKGKNWTSLKKADEVIRSGIKNACFGYYSNGFTNYSPLHSELRQASDVYSCLIIKLHYFLYHNVCFLFL